MITIDFETFYSKDFSLSKMTTEAYINDPQFEGLCHCGLYRKVKENH